jgi:hypothetical protein
VAKDKVLRLSCSASDKLKKITQRLSFGYCEAVCRVFFAEKCENHAAARTFGAHPSHGSAEALAGEPDWRVRKLTCPLPIRK